MVETNDRRLPVGIQSFEKIRKEGYLYVDKTDIIWQLANRNKTYNYLSRPRRFGKSVLVDTLEAYFMGKKELFEGLKIMQLEKEWVKRPVIRLDMSRAGAEPETLRSYLDITFDRLEKEYGITPKPTAQLADRFNAIIVGSYEQTGQQVAILIDEYDSPLQHSWKTPHHEACTSIYREVFAILKADTWNIIEFSFLGILGAQLGFYYTIGLCNAATATVLQYMAPLYVMLWMSYKSRKIPDGRELIGIVGALVGVFLIATHGSLDSLAISPMALTIGVLSALSYAYYSIKPGPMLKKYTAATLIGWGQLISGVALIIWRNPFTPAGHWDMSGYLAFAYLLLGATIASYALYLAGLKIVGPTKASLISCAEPLASIISVVLLLNTKLAMADYIGMACIIFTVLLLSLPKK